jgi:hypothetical protein
MMEDRSKQLAGLTNKEWIIALIVFGASLFAMGNEDFPNWVNIVGGIIAGLCVVRAVIGFATGR